jgi:thiol:disulfide interchange protein
MSALVLRIAILALVGVAVWLMVGAGRRFVESRRQRALAAALSVEPGPGVTAAVRILAFSSDDCVQCHRLQSPALRRVTDARPGVVIQEIDAPSAPELTSRYSVLTVPTTVVLDAAGRAHAVNYGFATSDRLLSQIDAVMQEGQDKTR